MRGRYRPEAAASRTCFHLNEYQLQDKFLNSSRIREWLEIVGLLGVVASLVFVGLEVRQSRQIAYMDQLGVARQLVSDYRQMLIANSDVWFRGCSGDELSDSERFVFTQLALELQDTVFTLTARGNIGLYASSSRWLDNGVATFHRYPAVQEAIMAANEANVEFTESTDSSEFAGGAFVGISESIFRRFAELNTLEPGVSISPVFCGNL